MRAPASLCQVVTFASEPTRGNPAFVLRDPGDASDATLAGLCDTLSAGVLAVIDDLSASEPRLRFFTPDGPHPGAGHATLAAAHVALHLSEGSPRASVTFRLAEGGRRAARREGERIAVGFPVMAMTSRAGERSALGDALKAEVGDAFVSDFGYVAVLSDARAVATLAPDLHKVAALEGTAVIATAPGDGDCHIVIRVFAPKVGLPEDPVCGTAHRIIVPYWADRLGCRVVHSRHLSRRGGDLWCEAKADEVVISGESRLVLAGTAELSST